MSVIRSHRLAAIRRREEAADRRKTQAIIGILCAFGAFAFVGSVILMGWK